MKGASEVYTDLITKPTASVSFTRFLFSSSTESDEAANLLKSSSIKPLKSIMNELRVFKSDAEIANMRKAGQISGRVFTSAMKHQWYYEKDLEAYMEDEFKKGGCDGSAYIPVVAGGMVYYSSNSNLCGK